MPQQVLCSALEKIIKQALALNINGNTALTTLNEKSLTILLAELGFPLTLTVINHSILVNADATVNASSNNCIITTSLETLWQLKQEQQLTELIKQDKLDLQGDIKIAQQFASLFENIDIDWQSELAKHIGDIPTYQLSQLIGLVHKKATFAARQISSDASEWLIHEKRLLVTNTELSQFNQAVDKTSQAVEQLSQRINQLSNKLSVS
mgnify:FL=1